MPVRLRQKIQTLPRGAGRRVALAAEIRLCYAPSQLRRFDTLATFAMLSAVSIF